MKIRFSQNLLLLNLTFVGLLSCRSGFEPQQVQHRNEPVPIIPDYTRLVIPPNIAPMNFQIQEKGNAFMAKLSGPVDRPITIRSRAATIQFPHRYWSAFLERNRGKQIQLDIYVKTSNKEWIRYAPITHSIAEHPIDPYLAYRLIKPLYVYWDQMGIYQRDLTSFKERPLFLNRAGGDNCVNCHSFHQYNPERFLLHMRAGPVGTCMILAYDGQVRKIDTSTSFNRAVAYRAWHPNGRIVAFSANTVNQFFHTVGENRDVYDKASDVLIYDVVSNTITTSPLISTLERMETYPEWSPDGRYLYYCVTDGLQVYEKTAEHPYARIKYDLMRISYDVEDNRWGDIETMINANAMGLSVTHPKASPDGRFVLLTMSGYGNFSIYKQDADLYLLDTQTKALRKLDQLNSDRVESYHSWSSNGRWLVFSSKRGNGLCARPYFSYMDENGKFSKPFVLPQKNPVFYNTFLKTYNIPEFINGPITSRPQQLAATAWDLDGFFKANLDPNLEERKEEDHNPMWKPLQKNSKK